MTYQRPERPDRPERKPFWTPLYRRTLGPFLCGVLELLHWSRVFWYVCIGFFILANILDWAIPDTLSHKWVDTGKRATLVRILEQSSGCDCDAVIEMSDGVIYIVNDRIPIELVGTPASFYDEKFTYEENGSKTVHHICFDKAEECMELR